MLTVALFYSVFIVQNNNEKFPICLLWNQREQAKNIFTGKVSLFLGLSLKSQTETVLVLQIVWKLFDNAKIKSPFGYGAGSPGTSCYGLGCSFMCAPSLIKPPHQVLRWLIRQL